MNIPARTIRGWANEAHLPPPENLSHKAKEIATELVHAITGETPPPEVVNQALMTVNQMTELKRKTLAVEMLDTSLSLVRRINAKRKITREAWVDDDGKKHGPEYEGGHQAFFSTEAGVVERWYNEMPPGDVRNTAVAVSLLNKEFRLEAGEVTDRTAQNQGSILDVVKDPKERDALREIIDMALNDLDGDVVIIPKDKPKTS